MSMLATLQEKSYPQKLVNIYDDNDEDAPSEKEKKMLIKRFQDAYGGKDKKEARGSRTSTSAQGMATDVVKNKKKNKRRCS